MSTLTLRPARSTDAGRTGAILSAFIDETPWLPRLHSRAEDLSFAADMIDRGWVTVAEAAGCVVGFAAREGGYVHALYVEARTRGQGCGAALLRAMQAEVDALSLWTFQANTEAQRFYTRHGFAAGARSDGAHNDEGLPDICMTWERTAG